MQAPIFDECEKCGLNAVRSIEEADGKAHVRTANFEALQQLDAHLGLREAVSTGIKVTRLFKADFGASKVPPSGATIFCYLVGRYSPNADKLDAFVKYITDGLSLLSG